MEKRVFPLWERKIQLGWVGLILALGFG
jgi:hypothetical protein